MEKWGIDIPVAINFFARANCLEKTFSVIRRVKPKVLFLIADGPRKDVPEDIEKVKKCKSIVANIDWDCDVYRYYASENQGLFKTYFNAMDQVFSIVDRCVFLEDDLVVSDSFFEYCRQLLIRYEHDLRIHFITGFNYMGTYGEPDGDYFFCGEGSIWGYALWKRTYESMSLDFRDNLYAIRCIKDVARQIKPGYEKRIQRTVDNPMWEGHIPHVEFYKNLLRFSENQIYIVPCRNMVSNIGVGYDAMHSADTLKKIPNGYRRLFFTQKFVMEFPLRHPQFTIRDLKYEKYVNQVLAWNSPTRKTWRKLVSLIKAIRYGDYQRISYKIKYLFFRDSTR